MGFGGGRILVNKTLGPLLTEGLVPPLLAGTDLVIIADVDGGGLRFRHQNLTGRDRLEVANLPKNRKHLNKNFLENCSM